MLGMLIYTAVSYFLLKRRVSTATPLHQNIKQSEQVDSPFVLGVFRPVIYLPYHIDETAQEYVIAHEQAHIRRRDHWWKPAGFLLLSVYWFNPLLWVAYIVLCRDIEAACDEKVIKEMEIDDRRAYSSALLDCSVHRRRIAACPLAFGETGVKSRIISVMNYKKPAFWVVTLSLLAVIITSVCLLTVPKSNHATIEWAQTLSAEDVEYVEFHRATRGSFHRLYSAEAIAAVVELMNHASGESIAPLDYYGEGAFPLTLTFVMKDGESHTVQHWGNKYLVIDGNHYESPYEWLYSWYGEVMTDEFLAEQNTPLKFIDLYESADAGQNTAKEYQLPDFPGVTFVCQPKQLSAVTEEGESVLISDAVIQNIYFWDLTKDGIRDICATVRDDSAIADTYIVMIDYAEGDTFTLRNSGKSDYSLRNRDGHLYCEQWTYSLDEHPHRELITRGNLVYKTNLSGYKVIDANSSVNNPLITSSYTDFRGFLGKCLYVYIAGEIYRYEFSDLSPDSVTAGLPIFEFTTSSDTAANNTGYEVWNIYTVQEYPDYSTLLAISDRGEQRVYQHNDSHRITEDDLQAAKDSDYVVVEGSDVTSGEQLWQDFLTAVNEGRSASVRIFSHYTLDPDHCTEELYEREKDKYPKLYVSGVTYDGTVYTITDKPDETFAYLLRLTFEGKKEHDFDQMISYVLTNDPDLTWNDYLTEKKPYWPVLTDLIYDEN